MISNTKTIITEADIEQIMRRHFGTDAKVSAVTELTEGMFNAIYIVALDDRELVLKTGIKDGTYVLSYEKDIMRAEVGVYGLLEKKGVPVPKILAYDFSHAVTDYDYFIMEKLQGDNWGHLRDKISEENKHKLIAELGRYTAMIGQIRGDWFGYIKDDPAFQYDSWRGAFSGMVELVINDGRKDGVELPYDEILDAIEPLWPLLDEVKEPRLVNFDMWNKNIMLIEQHGEYRIDGIIDHERAFYGDPYAEFISSETICGPIEQCPVFLDHYAAVTSEPLTFTKNDKIRIAMYKLYLMLLMGVEVYRYEEEDKQNMLGYCRSGIARELAALRSQIESE